MSYEWRVCDNRLKIKLTTHLAFSEYGYLAMLGTCKAC